MKNVKDEVFAALQAVCDNVSDVYPTSWVDLPAIQYTEEENRVYERTANKEDKASVRYRIDIWNSGSTSSLPSRERGLKLSLRLAGKRWTWRRSLRGSVD